MSCLPFLGQVLVIVLSVFLKPGLTTHHYRGLAFWMRISRLIWAETLSAKTATMSAMPAGRGQTLDHHQTAYFALHPAYSHRSSQQQYLISHYDRISPFLSRNWDSATAGLEAPAKCPIHLAERALYGDFARSLYPIDHLFLQ